MRTFQRTNWTNEQILKFLDGQKLVNGNGEVDNYCQDHNDVIDDIKDFFYDFMRPQEEFGAMGYCAEEDMVYHIGGLPEPLRVPIEEKSKCAIAHSPENESNFRAFFWHMDKSKEKFYCKVCGEDWP